jgi:hypothetical protein
MREESWTRAEEIQYQRREIEEIRHQSKKRVEESEERLRRD